MNRIILIGNGFDLAHGLKTSYADFIDWYWGDWGAKLLRDDILSNTDRLCTFELHFDKEHSWHGVYYNYRVARLISILDGFNGNKFIDFIKEDTQTCSFSYNSPLLEELCNRIKERNWVDIENVYFRHLCNDSEKPEKVNEELAVIRKRLIDYLTEVQKSASDVGVKGDLCKKMLAPFDKRDIAIGSLEKWSEMLEQRVKYYKKEVWHELIPLFFDRDRILNEISKVDNFLYDHADETKEHGEVSVEDNKIPIGLLLPDNMMMLNFNYTSIADSYLPFAERFSVNHIHGELSKPESVVFGYGDEIDENYKKILDKNDNEYLNNIKSIKYLESPNYRNLRDFIESDTYQVFIMGHSCGNSDRTLLNTLFEHKNCVSIKPFYYIRKDGTDNYMELVQNISRNFTDMKLMRDRVVNKTFCEPYSDARKEDSETQDN